MHILSNKEKEKCMDNYVDREVSVARQHFEAAETAIVYVQEDMRKPQEARLTSRKPEIQYQEMSKVVGDNLSYHGCSDDEEDGDEKQDNKDNPLWGKLSEDVKPVVLCLLC
jgi:hypothetical protein